MVDGETSSQEKPEDGWEDDAIQSRIITKEMSSKERKEKEDNQ